MQSEDEAPLTNGHGDPECMVSTEVIDGILAKPPPPLRGDVTFEETRSADVSWRGARWF